MARIFAELPQVSACDARFLGNRRRLNQSLLNARISASDFAARALHISKPFLSSQWRANCLTPASLLPREKHWAFEVIGGLALMWTTLTLVAILAGGETNVSKSNPTPKATTGKVVATTANFKVHSFQRGLDAAEVAAKCETLRSETIAKWMGDSSVDEWEPCCTIVLHRTRASYANAVGYAAARTSGSSIIDFRRGRICVRRIDLLAERNETDLSALPHELTHIVLADRFGEQPPPAWADEGMATLADSADKQSRHKRDLDAAISRGQTMPLAQLLSSEQYPRSAQWGAFYGQSTSLVGMLCERRDSDEFVRFVELGREQGYDKALRDVYDIDDIAELERLWRDHAYPETRIANQLP